MLAPILNACPKMYNRKSWRKNRSVPSLLSAKKPGGCYNTGKNSRRTQRNSCYGVLDVEHEA